MKSAVQHPLSFKSELEFHLKEKKEIVLSSPSIFSFNYYEVNLDRIRVVESDNKTCTIVVGLEQEGVKQAIVGVDINYLLTRIHFYRIQN